MPCEAGPSYVSTDELDEVKRKCDKLKKQADEATALLCQYGPMIPEAKRTLQLKKWLAVHAAEDRIRKIDEKIAALEKIKASIAKAGRR
jgi:uncharacterized coiled-coil DUF342 family protein